MSTKVLAYAVVTKPQHSYKAWQTYHLLLRCAEGAYDLRLLVFLVVFLFAMLLALLRLLLIAILARRPPICLHRARLGLRWGSDRWVRALWCVDTIAAFQVLRRSRHVAFLDLGLRLWL